jgi:hypothetical protein
MADMIFGTLIVAIAVTGGRVFQDEVESEGQNLGVVRHCMP